MVGPNKQSQISNLYKKRSPFLGQKEQLKNLDKVIPSALKKKDIQKMVPDEFDEVIELSEKMVIDWVHAYMEEIDRIQNFFINKQESLINEFISL